MKEAEFRAMDDNDRFNRVLEGEAYFASVHTPNVSAVKKFNADPAFMITLVLDKENQAKAKSFGLKVKDANDSIPGKHVKIKRKVKEGKTPDEVSPSVVDSMQREIPPEILIGNGSKVAVKFATYWPPNGDIHGAGTTLFKVQVKELVEYSRGDDDLGIDEGGFSVEDHIKEKGIDLTEKVEEKDDLEDEIPWEKDSTKGKKKGKVKTDPEVFDD